jgi:hypothetical protein
MPANSSSSTGTCFSISDIRPMLFDSPVYFCFLWQLAEQLAPVPAADARGDQRAEVTANTTVDVN